MSTSSEPNHLRFCLATISASIAEIVAYLGPRLDEFEATHGLPTDERRNLLHLTNGSPRKEIQIAGYAQEVLYITRGRLEEMQGFTDRVLRTLPMNGAFAELVTVLRTQVVDLARVPDASAMPWLKSQAGRDYGTVLADVARVIASLYDILDRAELDIQFDSTHEHRKQTFELLEQFAEQMTEALSE